MRKVDGVFFFNDTATTEIYTLSLHDALPIYERLEEAQYFYAIRLPANTVLREKIAHRLTRPVGRSEEHTSELQSLTNLVCRLLLEKKNTFLSSHPPFL